MLATLVRALLKADRCIPPSMFLMLLAKQTMFSVKLSVYCRAMSQPKPCSASVARRQITSL